MLGRKKGVKIATRILQSPIISPWDSWHEMGKAERTTLSVERFQSFCVGKEKDGKEGREGC